MAIDAFAERFGPPDPPTPPGLRFRTESWQELWDSIHSVTGAGWFCDGFLYLFGEGLERFQACVDAWSFLVPPAENRMILGRNAYGALLVLENADDDEAQSVHVLDPFTVTYGKVPHAHVFSLVGRVLPRQEIPMFLDDAAYLVWLDEHNLERIELNDVLGIKMPQALGGKLASDNLQIEDIVDYYQSTGPTYAAAFATLKNKP
jgi:hypothetical protein